MQCVCVCLHQGDSSLSVAADGKKVEQHQRTTGQLGGKDEDDEEEVKELQNEKGSGYVNFFLSQTCLCLL